MRARDEAEGQQIFHGASPVPLSGGGVNPGSGRPVEKWLRRARVGII